MTTQIKFTTAEEAVKVIKSGDHVHLSSVASAPQCLINAMCARGEAGELKALRPMPTKNSKACSSSTRSSWAATSAK